MCRLKRILGPSWDVLAAYWSVVWPSWGVLWPTWPPKSNRTAHQKTLFFLCFFNTFAFRSPSEANLLQHGPIHLPGAVLGASWGHLVPSWAHLGTILGRLGRVLERRVAVLGRLVAALTSQKRPNGTPKNVIFPLVFQYFRVPKPSWSQLASTWPYSPSWGRFGRILGPYCVCLLYTSPSPRDRG